MIKVRLSLALACAILQTGVSQAQWPFKRKSKCDTCAVPQADACATTSCPCAPPEGYPESDLTPEGQYIRAPESGEFAGESNSYGVRGFGLKLPSLNLEMPELRLPSLTHYRRNPEMIVDGSRAPFQQGRALEFNQVGRESNPESGLTPIRQTPESGLEQCVPPIPPCSARERRLQQELARKESELSDLKQQFENMGRQIETLAEERSEVSGRARVSSTPVEQPGKARIRHISRESAPDVRTDAAIERDRRKSRRSHETESEDSEPVQIESPEKMAKSTDAPSAGQAGSRSLASAKKFGHLRSR